MNPLKKLINWYFSRQALPYWCVLTLDAVLVLFSGYVGNYLSLGGDGITSHFWPLTHGLLLVLILYLACFRLFHTYTGILRYSSFVDLYRVAGACATAWLTACLTYTLTGHLDGKFFFFPGITALTVQFLLGATLLFGVRVVVKGLFDTIRRNSHAKLSYIYGVREGGVALAKSLRNESSQRFILKGFVSPSEDLGFSYLLGVKVYPDDEKLLEQLHADHIQAFFVSPLQADTFRKNQKLINYLLQHHVSILMMPAVEEWDGHSSLSHRQLHEVQVEDLLPRDKIEVDMEAIGTMLKGKSILITGAAGSIGSEIARQVVRFEPSRLILVDQAETPMHDVRLWMANEQKQQITGNPTNIQTIVGSITNEHQMERIFATAKPEYVFHAAAYKHVPMMEDNPAMAVQNNIYGTRVMADLAVKYGTRKFVMISTDKAVNPTNVMGCSKRICEIYCQSLNKHLEESAQTRGVTGGTCQFITTRFGNVLGSNGSVIPIFKEQIKKGGPVTVTHPDIIRFFMLIPEACRLVLEAGTMGHGGEIFVFDMGEPVRIVDLAKRMISLSGAKDVEIKFTGLRDGEKLYEEVLNDAEETKPTRHPKIKVASVREYPYELALKNEQELMDISQSFDDMAIVRKMKEIVPEYKSQHSKYEELDQ